jgi:peptide/nickel transport system substrate-binding protein
MKTNREREVGPMRGRMGGRRALVAATCAGLALAASAQVATGTPENRSNASALSTLKWGILHEIQTLDPALSYDGGGNNLVTYAECDSLLKFGDDLSLQPQIASSWKQKDKLTYVYTLRQDARFWDGKPVTASDVAFSFNRILDPKLASPLQSVVPTVKGMTATGKWQVTLKLKSPDPRARWIAALPTGQIVEKAFVQKAGKAFGTTPAKTMCSGPYQPTSWVKGQTVALKLVPNYWDKAHAPQAKTVTFQTIGDPAAMVAALRSGQLDGTFDLDGRNAGTINGGGLTVSTAPGNQINYISPNLLKGPLQDERVRRALSLAIDRKGLAFAVHGKYGAPLKAPIPPGLSTYQTGLFNSAYDKLDLPTSPDVSAGKKLVEQAGAQGKTVTIGVLASGTNDIVGPVIAQAGKSVGLNVVIKKLAPNDYFPENFSGKWPRTYDGLLNFWAADYPDPAADLVTPFGSKFSNVEGWQNAAYTKLTNQYMNSAPQSPASAQILAKMETMLIDKTVKIPLWVDPLIDVRKSSITGYKITKVYFYQQFLKELKG